MTKLLYLENSYEKECAAIIESVLGKEITLNQTIFYPRGGGQPSDKGTLTLENGEKIGVTEVFKKDGKVIHNLEKKIESEVNLGQKVHCSIDWTRRYKLMRMHTAAHVLGATMHSEYGILISGNQLEEDKTRFDFTMEDFDREKFERVLKIANEKLEQDIHLKVYSLPREEALKIPGVVKLAAALPPQIDILRIVEIPGIDLQADGGTHVKNLKEVGKIEILKLDNKGAQNRRIYFTLK